MKFAHVEEVFKSSIIKFSEIVEFFIKSFVKKYDFLIHSNVGLLRTTHCEILRFAVQERRMHNAPIA